MEIKSVEKFKAGEGERGCHRQVRQAGHNIKHGGPRKAEKVTFWQTSEGREERVIWRFGEVF